LLFILYCYSFFVFLPVSLPFLDYFHLFALYFFFIATFPPSFLVLFPSPVSNIIQGSHNFLHRLNMCLLHSVQWDTSELLTTSSSRIDVGGRSAVCCTYKHNEILPGGDSKLFNRFQRKVTHFASTS
jgi:hypothetical protein